MAFTEAFAADHHGVFTRTIVLADGGSDEVIRRQVKGRRWRRLRPGVFIEEARWQTLNLVGRHLVLIEAAVLRCQDDVVVTHVSGAVLRGLAIWNLDLDTPCLTRTAPHSGRTEAGLRHFDTPLPADQIEPIDGFRTSTVERLMVEVARLYPVEEAMVLCDQLLRLGADRQKALDIFGVTYRWPKASGAARAITLADGRSESVGESRLRYALHVMGVEGYEPNPWFEDADGHPVGRGDLVNREKGVLLEFDGQVKYGIDGQDPREQVWREKRREDWIREHLDYEIVRFTWADLYHPRKIVARIRAAEARYAKRHQRSA